MRGEDVRTAIAVLVMVVCTGTSAYLVSARKDLEAEVLKEELSLQRTRLPEPGAMVGSVPVEAIDGQSRELTFPAGGLLIVFRAGEYWSGVNWDTINGICSPRPIDYCSYVDTSGQVTEEFARLRGIRNSQLFRTSGRIGLEAVNIEPATLRLGPRGVVLAAVAGELTKAGLVHLGELAIGPAPSQRQ